MSEGDIYRLDFDDDRKAYEDYLELLGKKRAAVSSYRYNLFADGHRENPAAKQEQDAVDESEQSLKKPAKIWKIITRHSCRICLTRSRKRFFPEESIERCEKR